MQTLGDLSSGKELEAERIQLYFAEWVHSLPAVIWPSGLLWKDSPSSTAFLLLEETFGNNEIDGAQNPGGSQQFMEA